MADNLLAMSYVKLAGFCHTMKQTMETDYGTEQTYVHDAKNKNRCLKNKLLVHAYGGV